MKILIEIFCQKLIISNVTLAFLEPLKLKIFFVGRYKAPPLFKISGSTPAFIFLHVTVPSHVTRNSEPKVMDDARLYSFDDILCITPELAVKVALNSHFHWKVCFEHFHDDHCVNSPKEQKTKTFPKKSIFVT